jgi:hypothetical protein
MSNHNSSSVVGGGIIYLETKSTVSLAQHQTLSLNPSVKRHCQRESPLSPNVLRQSTSRHEQSQRRTSWDHSRSAAATRFCIGAADVVVAMVIEKEHTGVKSQPLVLTEYFSVC